VVLSHGSAHSSHFLGIEELMKVLLLGTFTLGQTFGKKNYSRFHTSQIQYFVGEIKFVYHTLRYYYK